MKLYELTTELQKLQDTDPEHVTTEFEAIDMIFTEKVLATARLIKSWIAEKEAIKTEKQRLADREKTLTNKIDNLKEYIKINMEKSEITNCKDEIFLVAVKKSPVSINVKTPDELPDDYKQYCVISLNQKIIQHFKDTGEQFENVEYFTNNTHLEIR